MKDKKLILLIGLSVLAIFSVIYGIVMPSKARRGSASGPLPIEKGVATTSSKDIAPIERQAKKSQFGSWGRNPFVPEGTTMQAAARLFLNGIVWDEKSPQAIINDRIVRVGDSVGDRQVVAIGQTSVILKEGDQELELRLGQGK